MRPRRYRVRGYDIVGICDAVGRAVISYIGPRYRTTRCGIVPSRVIERVMRDNAGWDTISPRAPTISCVCAISFAGRDVVPRERYRGSAWQYRRLSHDIEGRAWYRADPRYRERDARYRAASEVIAAPLCDIVKPHDIAAVSRYRVVCARYRVPVHDIVCSVNAIPLVVRS